MVNFQGTITVIGLVALGILVSMLVVVVLPKVVFHFMQSPLNDRIGAQYQPEEIRMKDLQALSFGRESAGVWQLRGNGGLVLTGKQVHFFMFFPPSNLCIPLDAIDELTITKSHLGKATRADLLKVRFSVDGKRDSIAWYLTDPKVWKSTMEAFKADSPIS